MPNNVGHPVWRTMRNQECVGETERPVCGRFAKHCGDARVKVAPHGDGSHYRPCHNDTPAMDFQHFSKASIIAHESSVVRQVDYNILEAMHIRNRDRQVNIDGGRR